MLKNNLNLVHHPTPEKQIFSYSEKKHPQAGFEPRTPTTNLEHTHALDCSAMAPMIVWTDFDMGLVEDFIKLVC